ncbi:hypothetical protein ACWD0Z_39095, partial [Streptomyces sp. NPDC003007]
METRGARRDGPSRDILDAAARGAFPPVDGGTTIVPQPRRAAGRGRARVGAGAAGNARRLRAFRAAGCRAVG